MSHVSFYFIKHVFTIKEIRYKLETDYLKIEKEKKKIFIITSRLVQDVEFSNKKNLVETIRQRMYKSIQFSCLL